LQLSVLKAGRALARRWAVRHAKDRGIHLYLDSKIHVYHDAGMNKKIIQISAAESQVMEALWRKAPLTPEDIIAATAKPNGWGAGTVRTLITRLLRKGALAGARQDGGYFYRPLISRADYVQAESQTLLDRLFAGQVAPLVAHFATQQKLTAADIKKLKKLIEELEE
jgi:predicted transcriptional regulator